MAYELLEKAWVEEEENWYGETMDGKAFSLPEPDAGEVSLFCVEIIPGSA